MTWDHVIALVDHLAWPGLVLVLLVVLRRQVAMIANAVAERVKDKRTRVTLGREGFTLEQTMAETELASERLGEQMRTDRGFEVRLQQWLKDTGIDVSTTSFLYGEAYRSLREAACEALLDDG